MSKNAPIIHTETFVATSAGSNFGGAFEEGTVKVTYMKHTFEVVARKYGETFALKGLTEGLAKAKKSR